MAKVTLNPISSGYVSTAALNENFAAIEEAFENTLSRDGSLPNQMEGEIDLNNNNLINVNKINGFDAASLGDISSAVEATEALYDAFDDRYLGSKSTAPSVDNDGDELTVGALYFNSTEKVLYVWTGTEWLKSTQSTVVRESFTATEGQTVFTLTQFSYTPGIYGVSVYVDGVRQFDAAYTETDSTTITLSEAVSAGTEVLVESGSFSSGLILNNASGVSFTPSGGLTAVTVQDAIIELDNNKFEDSVSDTSKLLGRYSAGSGDVEEISLGTGLSVAGGTLALSSLASSVTATTQAINDNSTKVATTAYADRISGNLLQRVSTNTSTRSTYTTLIPADDTIPQITEGSEVLSLSITPTSATSTLLIEAILPVVHSVQNQLVTLALFKAGTSNALQASVDQHLAGYYTQRSVSYSVVSGTTSTLTFSVRVGNQVSGYSVSVNGNSTTRLFGGASSVILSITEIK